MSWIIIIDNILSSKPVRWLLLVLVITCIVVTGASLIRQKGLKAELSATKEQYANLQGSLAAQNILVDKAGEDMEKLEKKLDKALSEAKKQSEELKKRKQEFANIKLTGSCENMVQQVVEELRK